MIVTVILRGGLGNCLFGICTTLAYSIKHGCDFCIPTIIDNPHYEGQKVFYSKYLKYCNEGVVTATVYKEPYFHYAEIPAPTSRYTLLDGYFQGWEYFDEYRKEILKILDIPYMRESSGSCSIHIRRTDYLKLPTIHPVVTNEYLQEAQIYMMNKGVVYFLVFSDDIEWCKESMPQFNDCEYYFVEGNTEIEDLSLASDCENSIGSNSSFSWWIYYLNRNKNKIGIFPKRWFGKDMSHDTKDLFMPEMILL